eukprot:3844635-Pyramimonas_sp.AAC.1
MPPGGSQETPRRLQEALKRPPRGIAEPSWKPPRGTLHELYLHSRPRPGHGGGMGRMPLGRGGTM